MEGFLELRYAGSAPVMPDRVIAMGSFVRADGRRPVLRIMAGPGLEPAHARELAKALWPLAGRLVELGGAGRALMPSFMWLEAHDAGRPADDSVMALAFDVANPVDALYPEGLPPMAFTGMGVTVRGMARLLEGVMGADRFVMLLAGFEAMPDAEPEG